MAPSSLHAEELLGIDLFYLASARSLQCLKEATTTGWQPGQGTNRVLSVLW